MSIKKTYIPAKPRNKKLIGTGGSGGISSSMSGAVANSHTHANKAVLDLFKQDSDGNVYLEQSFYSMGGISALGLGEGGSGGGTGTDLDRLDKWEDYNSTKAGWVLSAFLGKDLDTRVNALQSGSATNIKISGSGNAVTGVSKSGNTLTFAKDSTFSLSSHDHDAIYKPIDYVPSWGEITNKPSDFTPIAHTHSITDITGLQGALDLKATQSDIGTAIDGIEIGGRNLLLQSQARPQRTNSPTTDWIDPPYYLSEPLIVGQKYTFYCDSLTGATIRRLSFREPLSNINMSGNKTTFTATQPSTNVYVYFNETGATYNIGGVKLVKGDKCTDWTPSPEDVDAKIALVQTNLNTHASNSVTDVKHLTDAQLAYLNDLIGWWKVDASGNLYTEKNLYSTKGVSALGVGSNGGGSDGGADMLQSWETYTSDKASFYVPASLLVPFRSNTLSRLTALESGSATSIVTTGTGNAITSLTKSENVITADKGLTFALASHTHTFASLTNKPTTISGYEITDAYTKAEVDSLASYVGAYNFTNGFLVKTDVARTENAMLVLHIKGSSYFGLVPINTFVQAYNHTDSDAFIERGALNNGYKIDEVKVFYYDNLVYFWVPQQSIYQTMTFQLLKREEQVNRVDSVTNASVPTSGVEKMVTITPRTAWFEDTLTNLSQLTDNIGVGSHIANEANPHAVTKAQVGLGSVDNVKQATKSEFDTHTGNTTVHITANERTNWNDANLKKHTHENKDVINALTQGHINVLNLLSVVDGNIKVDTTLWATGGISALGLGEGGGSSGGGGVDMLDSWANYTEAKANYYVPSSLLVSFRDDTLDRLNAIEGGSATSVSITGTGDVIVGGSKTDNVITLTRGNQSWDNLSDKPDTFAPSAHSHNASDINDGTLALARIPTGTSGTTVALGNHLHTGVYEPVFTKNEAFNKDFGTEAGTVAQGNDSRIINGQTAYGWGNHSSAGYALNSALTAHINKDDNPHAVTKSQVGLGNVDNTSDANKPISTATQNALNLKAPLANPTFTGNVTAPTFIGALSGNASSATRLTTLSTYDANDIIGGASFNYGSLSWVNAPLGMSFGLIGNIISRESSSLSLQIAADIVHNSTLSTKDLWFRTANNLGFQNDWKKVWHSGNLTPVTTDTTQTITGTKTFTERIGADSGVKIGTHATDGLIEWDSTNNAFKFNGSLYATGGVSALGLGEGGSGGGGVDMLDSWANYTTAKANCYVPASLLVPFYNDYNSHGHTISDVTGLQSALNGKVDDSQVLTNVPANAKFTDTIYTHPSHMARASGLYKITVDSLGHVTGATAVVKADITALGIPAQDTTYGLTTITANGLMSATDKVKLNGIATGATANTGTVTSVGLSVPTGLSVSGTPITSSGTLSISLASGYSIPTTAKQANWDSAYGWGDYRNYGIGRTTVNVYTGGDADVPVATGLYSTVASSTANTPIFAKSGSIVMLQSGASGDSSKSQIWVKGNADTTNQLFFRHRRGSSGWNSWDEIYHTGNLTSLSQLTDNIGVTSHIENKANPHEVTTAQIGAVDLTTNQSIGGVKTFNGRIVFDVGTNIQDTDGYAAVWNVDNLLWRFGSSNVGSVANIRSEKVGIGTDNPLYKLDVAGDGNFTGSVTANNLIISSTVAEKNISFMRPSYNYLTADTVGGSLHFITNGDEPLLANSILGLFNNGNVGIGKGFSTVNPTAQLEVRGTGRFTGNVTASAGVNTPKIDFGNGFTIEPSGTELVFKFNGVIKQRMLSDGTILATAGITALSTE